MTATDLTVRPASLPTLAGRIDDRTATVGMVGLGNFGLVAAAAGFVFDATGVTRTIRAQSIVRL